MDLFTTVMICSMLPNNAMVNAVIKTDAGQNPLAVAVVRQAGQMQSTKKDFKNANEASNYAKQQLATGQHVNIGMMQIPSGWLDKLSNQGVHLDDLWLPCKNVAMGSDLINQAESYCATQGYHNVERDQCALSFYRTGDTKQGIDYAKQILSYAAAHPLSTKGFEIKPPPPIDYNVYISDASYELPVPNFLENKAQNTPATLEHNDDEPTN